MQLNSLGLVQVTNNGEQKLSIPKSLYKEVLRECHAQLFVDRVFTLYSLSDVEQHLAEESTQLALVQFAAHNVVHVPTGYLPFKLR